MMATYNVSFEYSLMGSVYIEAESEEEAREVVLNKYDGRCEKLPEDSRASFEDMELEITGIELEDENDIDAAAVMEGAGCDDHHRP